jgi:O-antigen/teichoic acid export membrane protein
MRATKNSHDQVEEIPPHVGKVSPSPEVLLTRTVKGSKWMLYLSGSALIAGFFTNVVLVRVGPEVLGFYGLLMLMMGLVNMFFMLGGSNVLVNYLPKTDEQTKPIFVFTYTSILVGFGAVFLSLVLLFPPLLELMFGSQLDVPVGIYLAIMLPVLLTQFLVWSILQAELRFRILAVSQNSVSWGYFLLMVLLVALGVVNPGGGSAQRPILLAAVLTANTVAIVAGVIYLRRSYTHPWIARGRWYLPGGFWNFTLTLYVGQLLNFLIVNAAPIFVVQDLGLRDLGHFRAVMVLAQFVGWIPMVLDRSFYPTLCTLVSTNQTIDDVYMRFSRYYMIGSSLIALVLLLFSREVLAVFGKSYSDSGSLLLVIFCAGNLLCNPIVLLNYALVTAYQKTAQTMISYAVGAVSAILLYNSLVPRYGLMGTGTAYFILQLIMLSMAVLLARRYAAVSFPIRSYAVSVCAVAVGVTGAVVWPGNLLARVGMAALFFVLLYVLRLVTRRELIELAEMVVPGSFRLRAVLDRSSS